MEGINDASNGASIDSDSSSDGSWLNEDNVDKILGHAGEIVVPEKEIKVCFQLIPSELMSQTRFILRLVLEVLIVGKVLNMF